MIEELVIKTEEDAWNTLQKALANEINDTAQIIFEGWPVFKLTIEGEDFKGSIPTRIMPPILELQKEIHRIYCTAKYNTEDTRKLKPEERDTLELIVNIKPGSTKFITDLGKALNEIIKSSNMTGEESVILLVSISAIIATTLGWKAWVSAKEREHGNDITVRMSEQETKRLEILTTALNKNSEIEKSQVFVSQFKNDLSKKLKPTDQIKIDGENVINGVTASEITKAPKKAATELRLDGEFIINEVKFPKVYGGEYRFSVTRVIDGKNLLVDVSPDKLTESQITILKESGFGVKKVIMQINAKELRGRISSASLFSIQWPDIDNK